MTSALAARAGAPSLLGEPGARLLAGPPSHEDFAAHVSRVGPIQESWGEPEVLVRTITESGLTGRGGAHFPLWKKLQAARCSPGTAVVVVNATESEPASAKDMLLASKRPHLILDGARLAAWATGADRVLLACHTASPTLAALAAATRDRPRELPAFEVVEVPSRYLAGESSALVSSLEGRGAFPSRRMVPLAVSGYMGRPTLVSNAETLAHLALLVRRGPRWFREAGTARIPGSVLLTVTGDVVRPGTVVELSDPATSLRAVVARAGHPAGAPAAVLLGGYSGRWIPARQALDMPMSATMDCRRLTPIGCGLVALIDSRRCPLEEAARLMRWLAGERAGQCGACDLGMPELAERVSQLASGQRRSRANLRRIASVSAEVAGRGLCGLPDGAVSMIESALHSFPEEVRLHRRGRCSASGRAGPSPLVLPWTP